ncbi:hypothetical protein K431DRAFT_280180 [Polychaeton citri CBS 116435]|uniref:Uncharacterized protein n=1 Tax=Polychaeton citri CBS 116435 TaxID=1314669 RepID=A0A9P4QIG4_9PEZI|nr:hypothetical protein K431DRAFT_280180 [Polychaeton citri CBS 116435]
MDKSRWAPQPSPAAEAQATTETSQPLTGSDNDEEERSTTGQSLSASAPTFKPFQTPPITDDGFAQTFREDGLFDDVVPLEETMQTRAPEDLFSEEFTPAAKPITENTQPTPQESRGTTRRGRAGREGGGRGRGRGTAARAQNQRSAAQSAEPQSQPQPQPPEGAPTGPRRGTSTVLANREYTGGARKPKLTEEELAERMASIRLKNESLTAAHVRAEADRASFAEREEKAKKEAAQARRDADKRTKEERKDRQQMMGERERNRLRKLKAMEGREWDSDKQEQDFSKGGRFDGKGFAGDQPDYTDGKEYLYREPRGSRGGGRGGRGGRSDKPTDQTVPKTEDFPALSSAGAAKDIVTTGGEEKSIGLEATATASGGSKSWAEQVESAG